MGLRPFVSLSQQDHRYATKDNPVVNFIQQPLPPGSTTGAGFEGQSGALDMGQRASTGLTTLFVPFPSSKTSSFSRL